MNAYFRESGRHIAHACINPTVGRKLAGYIGDALEDSESEEMELHLLDCFECKATYLTLLHIQAEVSAGLPIPFKPRPRDSRQYGRENLRRRTGVIFEE